jgi:hypothetical protein
MAWLVTPTQTALLPGLFTRRMRGWLLPRPRGYQRAMRLSSRIRSSPRRSLMRKRGRINKSGHMMNDKFQPGARVRNAGGGTPNAATPSRDRRTRRRVACIADLASDWHQLRCDPGKRSRRWGRRHPGGRGRVWDLWLAVLGSNSRRLRYCLCTCRMKRHSGGSGYPAVGPAG